MSAGDKSSTVDYILAQMAAGQTFVATIVVLINVLDGMDHADPTWGHAAALLDNRIEVSRYYSIEKRALRQTWQRSGKFSQGLLRMWPQSQRPMLWLISYSTIRSSTWRDLRDLWP